MGRTPPTTDERLRRLRPPDLSGLVAELTHDHGVSPDALRAAIVVLPVGGPWRCLLAPGVVACSPDVLPDPAAALDLVRSAFASGLRH